MIPPSPMTSPIPSSPFTRILAGDLPARLVHAPEGDPCVAMLSATPMRPGHVVVFPRQEIDSWLDLPPELAARLMLCAQHVGRAVKRAFPCEKIGVAIAGIEVRHVHLHLVPLDAVSDLDFSRQERNADPVLLDAAAALIRAELQR